MRNPIDTKPAKEKEGRKNQGVGYNHLPKHKLGVSFRIGPEDGQEMEG